MAWTDDQIDELYRKATAHQKAPLFKEEYWDEIEAMLDKQTTKKRTIPQWYIGVICVITTAIVGGYYLYNHKETTNKSIEHTVQDDKKTYSNAKQINVTKTIAYQNTPQKGEMKTQQNVLTNTVVSYDKERVETVNEPTTFNDFDKTLFVESNNIESSRESSELPLTISKIDKHKPATLPLKYLDLRINSQAKEPLFGGKLSCYSGIGFATHQSYKKHSPILNVQWNVKIGLNYAYTDRLRLGFGLGFRRERIHVGANGQDLAIRQSRIHYSLGEIRQDQTIAYDRIQFLDLNIHAHYLFGNIRLGLQLTPSYTLGAKGYMSETGINLYDKNGTHKYSYREEQLPYARTKNISSFGLNTGLTLQYEFDNKTILELSIHSRLNKMLMNNQFEDSNRTFPLRIEVGFIKHFTK